MEVVGWWDFWKRKTETGPAVVISDLFYVLWLPSSFHEVILKEEEAAEEEADKKEDKEDEA